MTSKSHREACIRCSGMTEEKAALLEAHNTLVRVVRCVQGGDGPAVPDAESAASLLTLVQRYLDGEKLAQATLAARAEEQNWRERLAGRHQ